MDVGPIWAKFYERKRLKYLEKGKNRLVPPKYATVSFVFVLLKSFCDLLHSTAFVHVRHLSYMYSNGLTLVRPTLEISCLAFRSPATFYVTVC